MSRQDWVDKRRNYVGKITGFYEGNSPEKPVVIAVDETHDDQGRVLFPTYAVAVTAAMGELAKVGATIRVITIEKYDDVVFESAWLGDTRIA